MEPVNDPKPKIETEMDIGAETVASTGEPTKSVEEMQELMGVDNTPQGEQKPEEEEKVSEHNATKVFVVQPQPESNPIPESNYETVNTTAEPTEFDPAYHCVDENGNPIRTKSGKFRRKPGRRTGGTNAERRESQFESFTSPAPLSTIQMLTMAIDSTTLICAKFFGDEWKTEGDERAMLIDAYSRFVHYKGWDSAASPELVLIGVTLTYLMPRIMTDKFLKKLKGMGKKNAHSNSGTNGVGQNHVGQSDSTASGTVGNESDNLRSPPIDGMGGTIDLSKHR
jgi:hypothetical protein